MEPEQLHDEVEDELEADLKALEACLGRIERGLGTERDVRFIRELVGRLVGMVWRGHTIERVLRRRLERMRLLMDG